MSKMDDFIERFQSLPPELYTEIRNLTITPDFPKTCHIDESYKPPNILQVNQQTRLELTCEFYANTIFTFPNNLADSSTKCVLKRWLNLLSMKQRQSLLSSELHILTELKIQNYFSPAQRGLGVIFHSNCMARTDQIALGTLGRNVHKAFSGYDVLWRVNMMENVRFVCLMDDGLEALVNVDFKSKSKDPRLSVTHQT